MKLKIDDTVYLQKYEVAYIMHALNRFPSSILQETFGGKDTGMFFFMCDLEQDGFSFECAYKEPKNVEWLMKQDWIVDYDKYPEDMSPDEIETLRGRLEAEFDADVNEFNNKDNDYKTKHYNEESEKFDKRGHEITSLEYLIKFRKGEAEFSFPDEFQGRKTFASIGTRIRRKLHSFTHLFHHGAQ